MRSVSSWPVKVAAPGGERTSTPSGGGVDERLPQVGIEAVEVLGGVGEGVAGGGLHEVGGAGDVAVDAGQEDVPACLAFEFACGVAGERGRSDAAFGA